MDLDVQFDYLFLAHGKKCQIKLIGLNILFLSHTLNTEKSYIIFVAEKNFWQIWIISSKSMRKQWEKKCHDGAIFNKNMIKPKLQKNTFVGNWLINDYK